MEDCHIYINNDLLIIYYTLNFAIADDINWLVKVTVNQHKGNKYI